MSKLLRFFTILTVFVIGGAFELNAQDFTSTLSFSSTKTTGKTAKADDDAVWNISSDATEQPGSAADGIHYGSKNQKVKYIHLSTKDINGTIKKVVVNARDAANSKTTPGATLSVTVGSTALGTSQTTTNETASYTFEGSIECTADDSIIIDLSRASSTKKALYVKSIVVTYANDDMVSVPVISGDDAFSTTTTEVTITGAEGTTVYYTLDGSDPTNASTQYSGPFTINATTTVKAIAYNGGNKSDVVEKTFTKLEEGAELTATFKASSDVSDNQELSKDGVTITVIKGSSKNDALLSNGKEYRFYTGSSLKFSTDRGYIEKVVLTCAGTGTNSYNPSTLSDPSVGTYTYTDNIGTWIGETSEFTLSVPTGQARINQIDVTYKVTFKETASIKSIGYATYVTKHDIDFSKSTDVKAFKASYDNAKNLITLTPIDAAPVNTPVVLKGTNGEYDLTFAETEPAALADNSLLVSNGSVKGDGSTIWVLSSKDSYGVGFYPLATDVTIPDGRAYLKIGESASASAKGFIGFNNGSTTGIDNIVAEPAVIRTDLPMYNIAGQRVSKSYKGVVIQNGKKYILK